MIDTVSQHKGLSSAKAEEQLRRYGSNQIIRLEHINPFQILLRQFRSPLIIILIAAAIISLSISFLPQHKVAQEQPPGVIIKNLP